MLREENDVFGMGNTDRYYTQGLEMQYVGDSSTTNGITTRNLCGLRNLIYTPQNIAIAKPQPFDRPWAGLMALSYTTWRADKTESVSSEWMLGVVGPWSQSDHIQTEFHRLIKNRLPMGWTNQIPNEPIVNYTEEHFQEVYLAGSHNGWGFDVVKNYGYSVGNAFVYGDGGFLLRAGWCIPKDCQATIIAPTLTWNKYSLYVFAGANGKLMFQNITLGGSLFQDGPAHDLKPLVLDINAGTSLVMKSIFGGETDFGLMYTLSQRSNEFDNQKSPQSFGSITLALVRGI